MASLVSKLSARHQRDYSPVAWTQYFDEAHDISPKSQQPTDNVDEAVGSYRVYLRNFKEPYAPQRQPGHALDGSRVELSEEERAKFNQVPTLVALHGGGYSGLTWAQFTRHIEQYCHCRILAIDLRGHGDTTTPNDDQMDIDTLVQDVISVTHAAHRICGFQETPRIVLIGHSMGGAVAVKCSVNCPETLPSLAGFVIIDVVEGTAKDALPLMMSVIKTRPVRFPSLSNAIEWSVRSGMAKNSDAARVSMPGNLVNICTEKLAIHDVEDKSTPEDLMKSLKMPKFCISVDSLIGPTSTVTSLPPRLPLPPRISALKGGTTMPPPIMPKSSPLSIADPALREEPEEDEDEKEESRDNVESNQQIYKRPAEVDESGYCWRTNLAKTQPYWNGWFDGLSEQLLSTPVQAKFLLLAGIDRLDKTLTIGHMQGKFMMKVLPKCGHAVHEDVPEQVAGAIGDFLVRNKLTTALV